MGNIRALFFDFDYTLADASEAIAIGFRHACSVLHLPYLGDDAVRRGIGGTLQEIFQGAVGELSLVDDFEAFAALYRSACNPVLVDETVVFADVPAAFETFKKMGLTLCIVTNKDAVYAKAPFVRDGLDYYITRYVGRHQMPAPKPDPRGTLNLMEELGLAKDEVLFVGDSLFDAKNAQNAGIGFAAVLTGTTSAEEFCAYPARFIAKDLSDLAAMLEKDGF